MKFPKSSPISLTILSIIFLSIHLSHAKQPSFGRTLSPSNLGLNKKEKLSHFRLYWHDVVSGSNPTAIPIASAMPTNRSSTQSQSGFGTVIMIDDALTMGPELGSKLVGRAQGFYAIAAQNEVGLLMAMNFAFIEGKYNGSTISILGRNRVFTKVREMPIIGGSGLFRFARGFVQAKTHSLDFNTGDAVVEYDIYVMHY